MRMRAAQSAVCIFLITSSANAQTVWYVDDDCEFPGSGTEVDPFCTIQNAVNAANDGDTVLVHAGVYTGTGNRDISLFGKTITLRSIEGPEATTIDIEGNPQSIHRGFFLIYGETRETIIKGFTIINAYLIGDTGGTGNQGGGGGAIYIRDSSPTITKCIIRDNISAQLSPPWPVDGRGAGIYIDGGSSAVIEYCTIANNVADRRGGGLYIGYNGSSVTIRNCLITGNSAAAGGGIYNTFGGTSITNTTIAYNSVLYSGGGIHNERGEPVLSNCTLWGNSTRDSGPQIFIQGPVLTIEYSVVQGGLDAVDSCCSPQINWGPGMIDADPLFVDELGRDLHLSPGSPCIDAGNNLAVPEGIAIDLDGNPRFVDDPSMPDCPQPFADCGAPPIVDMGAYEFQPCPADFDEDGRVSASDLARLLASWGPYGPCPPFGPGDFNEDCEIGAPDLAQLLAAWGPCP